MCPRAGCTAEDVDETDWSLDMPNSTTSQKPVSKQDDTGIAVRRCKKCGETKPLDDFYKMKGCIDGRRPTCKRCCLEVQKAYSSRPEVKAARRARWGKMPPEELEARRARIREYNRVSGRYKRSSFFQTMRTHALKGPCVVCGFDFLSVVDMHHLYPETKHAKAVSAAATKFKKQEYKKCIPLCKNHHYMYHNRHEATVTFIDSICASMFVSQMRDYIPHDDNDAQIVNALIARLEDR